MFSLGTHCPDPATLALEVLQLGASADRVGLPFAGTNLSIGCPVATFRLEGTITSQIHLKELVEFIGLLLTGKAPVTMISKSEVPDINTGILTVGEGLRPLHLPHQAIVLLADTVAEINKLCVTLLLILC